MGFLKKWQKTIGQAKPDFIKNHLDKLSIVINSNELDIMDVKYLSS